MLLAGNEYRWIAEGLETSLQVEQIKSLQREYGHGYFF
jgi:EAL domain-containing protein (putative c-di-GMP-specific phosphodiesterase class I)